MHSALRFNGAKRSTHRHNLYSILRYNTSMNEIEEIRWRIVKDILDKFPELRRRVKEYLREENEKKRENG